MTGFGEIGQNGRFWAKMAKTGLFCENPKMTLLYAYYAATLCKKPEQTYERILRSKMYERANGHTDERTHGRTHTRKEGNLKVPTACGGEPKSIIK